MDRAAFEAYLKTLPEWAPEFEQHRAWVEQFAWFAWQAAALAERARHHGVLVLQDGQRVPLHGDFKLTMTGGGAGGGKD